MWEPDLLPRLNEVCAEENLPLIRDFLIVHSVVDDAQYLDRECYEWSVEAGNAINGSSGMLDDATAFSQEVASLLEWPVARLYTEAYLKQEDKGRITEVVNEIKDAYHGILMEADFLSEETRAKAIEKLDSMGVCVLYPDNWEPYSCEGLEIASPEEGETLWHAMQSYTRYSLAKSVRQYSEPVDREIWDWPPQIAKGCYTSWNNRITILGALAQGDIYNSAMSDEEVLAKIGYVIGHEISHGFDSTGAQFDKDGNVVN